MSEKLQVKASKGGWPRAKARCKRCGARMFRKNGQNICVWKCKQ